jgi:DNA-binding CsgD family transcriptional regulator
LKDDALIDLISSIGQADFPARALAFIDAQVVADHVALLVFDEELVPRFAGAASRSEGKAALLAGRIYERGMFYRFDPSRGRLRAGSAADDVILFRIAASDIPDATYRSSIYGRFGIVERVSLLRRVLGRWMLMNVYRNRTNGQFEPTAMAKLTDMAPLLIACAGKHVSITAAPVAPAARSGSAASFESMLKSLDARLTERERQVCAHALGGVTVAGIASLLGVKESTVATLRRRAYAKLGISNLNSLFALCVAQLGGGRVDASRRGSASAVEKR